MYVDGVSSTRGLGVGVVLVSLEGVRVEKSLKLGFWALNNEAEYKALIVRLCAAQKLGAKEVEVVLESRLVVSQVDRSFEARDQRTL